MPIVLQTENKPVLCTVEVEVREPMWIRIVAAHPKKRYTKYTDRYHDIQEPGRHQFFIRMPQSPEEAYLYVNPVEKKHRLMVGPPMLEDLYIGLKKEKWTDPNIVKFVDFSQDFCENAGWLSSQDSIYMSDGKDFRIDYKDVLLDEEGKPSRTPARISPTKKVIELNKDRYLNYTIPQRMAINLHEFAHCYRNKNVANEFEADMNALLIALGLGYPSVDVLNGFLEVFETSPAPINAARWVEIKEFVRNFDNSPRYIQYS